MRPLLFFFVIFKTLSALAVDCTDLTTTPCDSLIINNPINLTGTGGAAIVINVTGNVEINADITLSGAQGFTLTADNTSGPQGGPGAEEGGGISLGEGQPQFSLSTSSGLAPLTDPTCSNGGGGGGFITAGLDGSACATSTTPVGTGGTQVLPAEFDFAGPFRGGFGGGAGGTDEPSPTVFSLGSGGGGGGALHINATGTITIRNGVRLSARGGNGGNASFFGGGGGGGSGGVIWLQTTSEIINLGIIDVRPGAGGRNSSTNGGHGGNGGNGIYRLESSAGIISGSDLLDSSSSSSSSKLKSDITCGTIGKTENNDNLIFQILMGFALAILIRYSTKMAYSKFLS